MKMHGKKGGGATSGFTIVELLIVIVVIAILAAVTIVAYRGITRQAEQSQLLSTLDGWEKALRLEKAEKGYIFSQMQPGQVSNPDPNNPNYSELSSYRCFPGDYPANDDFREGECNVNYIYFTPDATGVESLVYRQGTYVADEAFGGMSQTLTEIPKMTGKNSITEMTGAIRTESNPITGAAGAGAYRQKTVTRGALIITVGGGGVNLTGISTVAIQYTSFGSQACGRGKKLSIPLVWTRDTVLEYIQQTIGQDPLEYIRDSLRQSGVAEGDLDGAIESFIDEAIQMNSGGAMLQPVAAGAESYVTRCTLVVQ